MEREDNKLGAVVIKNY